MTFMVYGLDGHELMPLDRLFDRPVVEKTQAAGPGEKVRLKERSPDNSNKKHHAAQAGRAYREIEKLHPDVPVLLSGQIMSSPVVKLGPDATVAEAQMLFNRKRIRHLPVVSSAGCLVGLVSERDILRCIGGVTEHYEPRGKQWENAGGEAIERLMQKQVLTATVDTDVRYIALLFVRQRVGGMPIMAGDDVVGIITRSDILRAVTHHYMLELWA